MELDAAWLLVFRARRTSTANVDGSEAWARVVDRMLQLHGGDGHSRGCLIERIYRGARASGGSERDSAGRHRTCRVVMTGRVVTARGRFAGA